MVVVEERLLSSATGGETEQNQYSTSTDESLVWIMSLCEFQSISWVLVGEVIIFQFWLGF